MTDHYAVAERCLVKAANTSSYEEGVYLLAKAQVHATLAQIDSLSLTVTKD